jgi:hypothetical protein
VNSLLLDIECRNDVGLLLLRKLGEDVEIRGDNGKMRLDAFVAWQVGGPAEDRERTKSKKTGGDDVDLEAACV